MEIRPSLYTSAELGECYQLDAQMMQASWPIHHWLELAVKQREYHLRVLDIDGVVGFSLWKVDVIDKFAHLLKIVVRSDYQGQGFGRKQLESDLSLLQEWGVSKFYLEVAEDNDAAVSLYRSYEFKTVNRVKQFYSDGGDALILYKEV